MGSFEFGPYLHGKILEISWLTGCAIVWPQISRAKVGKFADPSAGKTDTVATAEAQ